MSKRNSAELAQPSDDNDEALVLAPKPKKAKKGESKITQPRSAYWCFTINNPDNSQIPRDWPEVRYCIWQVECGAEGTRHIQGYVVWNKTHELSWCKNTNERAHWEMRRGKHSEARDYCKKGKSQLDGPWEIGDEARCVVRDGVTISEAIDVLMFGSEYCDFGYDQPDDEPEDLSEAAFEYPTDED